MQTQSHELLALVLFLLILFGRRLLDFAVYAHTIKQYKNESYYQITKNSYLSVKRDAGKHGEYLTYKRLKRFEEVGGKFLFNILIPKGNETSTEIDMLLICPTGLFVFECKNFSGWIFGNESQKNWTQTLPKGWGRSHKESFYNPVMQNASHIKHLKNLVGQNVPMQSIIVFADRCTLKNVTINSTNVCVINLRDAPLAVAHISNQCPHIYTEKEINDIYNKLYPYTQLGDEVNRQHTENVRKAF